jgi:hypothetical protein
MKMDKVVPFITALLGLGAMAAWLSVVGQPASLKRVPEIRPTWTEFQWPFPVDEWGIGRAFVCKATDCGAEANIYIRPKIGFCNCVSGIIDDAELDRVGDKELIAKKSVASGSGLPIEIAWMKGRGRRFEKTDTTPTELLSMAFHDGCNLMVAVATFTPQNRETMEVAVTAFLASDRVLRWVKWLAL